MSTRAPWWREALLGLAVSASVAAGGAAVNLRDRVAAAEAEAAKACATQAERERLILYRLDQLQAGVDRIDQRLP